MIQFYILRFKFYIFPGGHKGHEKNLFSIFFHIYIIIYMYIHIL